MCRLYLIPFVNKAYSQNIIYPMENFKSYIISNYETKQLIKYLFMEKLRGGIYDFMFY